MSNDKASTPLVLLVAEDRWTSRSIESVLNPNGYVVLKATSGRQALDLVGRVSPDCVIVDFRLDDLDGVDTIRELREAATAHAATPFFMMTATTLSRDDRLRAFGAGVWDILRQPVDPYELTLRMKTFVGAKRAVDQVKDSGLTDPATGFYNIRGVLKRAREVTADAVRTGRPFSAIALGSELSSESVTGAEAESGARTAERALASILSSLTRLSDAVGSLGPGEFIILAPGTDREGAVRLTDRVFEAVEAEAGRAGAEGRDPAGLRVRAGFHAVETGEEVESEDLLQRATTALRRAQVEDGSFRLRSYDA